ncbi:MAG: cupin domain-containing protein [Actinomycetales bacterium]
MIQGFDASSMATERADLLSEKSLAPNTWTGYAEAVQQAGFEVGVWEHSVGSSHDSFGDEVFVVLAGRGVVRCDGGGEIVLAPGVVGVLSAGDHTTWEITEPLRKVWIVRNGS